jgi:hypothetical protein
MRLSPPKKQTHSFHVYQMSSDEDYFYNHPNTVLLGFLGTVAVLLLILTVALRIATV